MNNNIYKDVYTENHEDLFLNKHKDSFIAGYLINEKKALNNIIRDDRRLTIVGYILMASIFLNIYQASLPQKDILNASYSNNSKTIQRLTTLPSPVNTVPLIIKWAKNSLTQSLTFGFYNYDKHLLNIQSLFTSAGYSGFVKMMDSTMKDVVIKNRIDVTTIPFDTAIMSHMYSQNEPYWIVQVPVIINYSVGIATKDVNKKVVLEIKIIPVKGILNQNGKEIDSIKILE